MMSPWRRFSTELAVVAAAFVSGCGSPLSVEELTGEYPLSRVDWQPLPVTHQLTTGCAATIAEGGLSLSGTRFQLLIFYDYACPGEPVAASRISAIGRVSLDGNTIHLVEQGPGSFGTAYTGTVDGESVDLVFASDNLLVIWGAPPLRFGPRGP